MYLTEINTLATTDTFTGNVLNKFIKMTKVFFTILLVNPIFDKNKVKSNIIKTEDKYIK